VDLEIDALDGGEIAVVLGEGADLNERRVAIERYVPSLT